jgi:hypothetical protein
MTTAITIHDLIAKTEATIELVDRMLPQIEFVTELAGPAGAPALALEQAAHLAAPRIEDLLKFAMQETGKSLGDVFTDFMNHITPGLPNSPVLAGPVDKPGV